MNKRHQFRDGEKHLRVVGFAKVLSKAREQILKDLGTSGMSQDRACAAAVASHHDRGVDEIFGHPDNLKFHSSMTLFADVAPHEAIFQTCLDQFFDGRADPATLDRLA